MPAPGDTTNPPATTVAPGATVPSAATTFAPIAGATPALTLTGPIVQPAAGVFNVGYVSIGLLDESSAYLLGLIGSYI